MPSTTVTEEIRADSLGQRPGRRRFLRRCGGDGGDGGDSSGRPDVPQRAYVTGMFIALAGILMFFMAFVSAYIVRKGMPNSAWIPLQVPRILWLNTLILIASSFTLRARAQPLHREGRRRIPPLVGYHDGARHSFRRRPDSRLAAARRCREFSWPRNPSSSFFYVFTGAHGLHLLGGILALLYVQFRATRKVSKGTAIEVVSMYWHFMDGLWVFLFLLLYLGR